MTITPLAADEQLRLMVRALMRINFTEGHGCGNHPNCGHDGCKSSFAAWSIADKALHQIGALPLPGRVPLHDQAMIIEELPPIAKLDFYAKAFEDMWSLLVLIEMGGVQPESLAKLRKSVSAAVFGPDKDPEEKMVASVAYVKDNEARLLEEGK